MVLERGLLLAMPPRTELEKLILILSLLMRLEEEKKFLKGEYSRLIMEPLGGSLSTPETGDSEAELTKSLEDQGERCSLL